MPKELRSDRRDDIFKEYVIARIEKSGEKFEVLVKPDAVQRLRDGKDFDLMAELAIDQIFRELVLDDRSAFDRALQVAAEFDTLQGIYAELQTEIASLAAGGVRPGLAAVLGRADELGDTFSDEMIDRIDERLGHPERCPHGWPVDPAVEQAENDSLAPLATLAPGTHATPTSENPAFIRLAQWPGLAIQPSITAPTPG